MNAEVEFWFEFASTYSYLAVCRVEATASRSLVNLKWRPFLLGPIFAQQGWNDSPFNIYPAKGKNMWRDMERLCQKYGLGLRRPSQFPRNGLLAARVAHAMNESAMPAFVKAVYAANFAEDRDISAASVIREILQSLGADADAMLASAQSDQVKNKLRSATADAIQHGIFGAPSFVVGDELFCGNDRLEDAIEFAARKTNG